MQPLFVYKESILDSEMAFRICKDVDNILSSKSNIHIVGIYFENLKNIRQESFIYLKKYFYFKKQELIIYDIPMDLRIHFYLEDIPIRFGCAFINSSHI